MKITLALVALGVVLAGCNMQIPNTVMPDEYEVYSQWMKFHFSKHAPDNLYLKSRTFVFDSISDFGCAKPGKNGSGVPSALINQLHALGTAEYPLDIEPQQTKLQTPWSYKVEDDGRFLPKEPEQYRLIEFSRVAFDHAHKKAFFAFSDSCGGLCGRGGTIYAHKNNGTWTFENGGCDWVY